MPTEPLGRPRRVEWRLPLTIAALLAVVVGVFTWAAYREVRAIAFGAAEERVLDVAGQLAQILSGSVAGFITESVSVADAPLLEEALDRPSPHALERAQAELNYQLDELDQVRAVELWDTEGVLVANARRNGEGTADSGLATFPEWAEGHTAAVSGFRPADDGLRYAVAARVDDGDRPLGYVVHHRALSTSPESVRQLEGLVGSGVTFKVGVPGGTWTNLTDVVEGPTGSVGENGGLATYEDGEGRRVLGAGASIRSSPWLA